MKIAILGILVNLSSKVRPERYNRRQAMFAHRLSYI